MGDWDGCGRELFIPFFFRRIAANPDAPSNQEFQLQKPEQGAGRGDTAVGRGLRSRYKRGKRWREEFKVQIYTLLCISLTIGLVALIFYVILPEQGIDTSKVDPLKKIKRSTKD